MKNLISFLLLTIASIRSASSGKTLVVSNFPEEDRIFNEKDEFVNRFSNYFEQNPNLVTHIENPHYREVVSKLKLGLYDKVVVQSHGKKNKEIPTMNLYGRYYTPFTNVLEEINSSQKSNLNQIHLSSCFIGKDINQLQDSKTLYYNELNNNLRNNQLLFLHGDEYTGDMTDSFSRRLPNLILNKEYSIIEALLDSGESLNVIFKKDNQLKVFIAKTFGRNGEEWTIENYRNYLREVAAEAKDFEVKNEILGADAKRPDIEKISDEELIASMNNVFIRYFCKLLEQKDFIQIQKLITKVADLNIQNQDGSTALMIAIDHFDIAKELIAQKADPNIKNQDGWTALMYAANRGYIDIANELIAQKAELNIKNKDGSTALIIAADRGHFDIVKELIAKGADPNIKNKEGWTALMIAADNGHFDIAKELIAQKADLNIKNKDGLTALIIAADRGHFDIVKELIDKGADPNIQNPDGWTSLMYAIDRGHFDIAKELIAKGANVSSLKNSHLNNLFSKENLQDTNKIKDLLEIALMLDEKGIKLSLTTEFLESCHNFAQESANPDIIKIVTLLPVRDKVSYPVACKLEEKEKNRQL